MQDQLSFFKRQVLIGGKLGVCLRNSGMQPVAHVFDKRLSICWQPDERPIGVDLLCILVTALNVEIPGFEIPEHLREDGDLEMPSQNFGRRWTAFGLSRHELPPCL